MATAPRITTQSNYNFEIYSMSPAANRSPRRSNNSIFRYPSSTNPLSLNPRSIALMVSRYLSMSAGA
jgi:hypothetical protein